MTAYEPIPPRPYLRQEVFQILKARLTELAFGAPGPVHVREAELARWLGVSRTPVREALSRLERDGLVTVIPHKGARIVPTSVDEYLAWLDVREVLEGAAARLAATRLSEPDLGALHDLLAAFDEATIVAGSPAYAEANVRFHALILERSANRPLQRALRQYDHMEMVQLRIIERLGRARASLGEHRAILAALARRDEAGAEAAARAHVRNLRHDAARHLSSMEAQSREEAHA